MRLGWWRREAGQPLEAVKTYRGLLAAYPRTAEAAWARAGLVRALLDLDDYAAARAEARLLRHGGPHERPRADGAAAARSLRRREESHRGCRDAAHGAARARARRPDPRLRAGAQRRVPSPGRSGRRGPRALRRRPPGPGQRRGPRLRRRPARADRARGPAARAGPRPADRLLTETPTPAVRVLRHPHRRRGLLRPAPVRSRGRLLYAATLAEPSQPAAASSVRLALGWAELRRGRPDAARAEWVRFVRDAPGDSRVPAVLLLSAEQAAQAGDDAGARALLDRLIARFPDERAGQPRAPRTTPILAAAGGRRGGALRDLDALAGRAADSRRTSGASA